MTEWLLSGHNTQESTGVARPATLSLCGGVLSRRGVPGSFLPARILPREVPGAGNAAAHTPPGSSYGLALLEVVQNAR